MKIVKPKILFYDLETKPVKVWAWRTGKQYVNHSQIVEGEKFDVITIAWKWLNEKKIHCLDWGVKTQNSAKMINNFAKVLEMADVVIGQNNISFDDKIINTQRMLHGQPPIAWPTSECMRRQILKHFYVTSSSLEYMSRMLTGEGKDRMNFADWVDIVDKKCPKALAKMRKYNMKDVKKTEEVWKRIAPYVTVKASRARIMGIKGLACPSCGSTKVQNRGKKYLMSSTKTKYRCFSCSGYFYRPDYGSNF